MAAGCAGKVGKSKEHEKAPPGQAGHADGKRFQKNDDLINIDFKSPVR